MRAIGQGPAAAYRGVMDRFLVGREYAGHLTDADLGLLASVAAADTGTAVSPGPLSTGPLTGAQHWTEPPG